MFTENNSNIVSLGGLANETLHTKDAFHRHLIGREKGAVSNEPSGTKAAPHFHFIVPPGGTVTVRCRLHAVGEANGLDGFDQFEETFAAR